ncbi:hypothetical protein METH_18100 [Leisingera methylohalidivorans DSM 14336]|uniref:Uncharacterized protein n=1 Tax=Leisingera methylohalidivorans DSM 14336 TaxID=999552 RepID=V9VX14_9RHOB|nr:hypothetical protein METH_18100 [Leisingera methylohalidivorans DSM 14336]
MKTMGQKFSLPEAADLAMACRQSLNAESASDLFQKSNLNYSQHI